ncbi:MAG TPA: hypothetical protein VJU53_12300 [Burkholderiaceae bacterium]|nr:hypothetical protein [Burkholderiaceae bacterium]
MAFISENCIGCGRFVIRDASARRTIGGGTVLDVMPHGSAARRGRRAPARLQLLAALRDSSPADALRAWLQRSPVPVARLASGWNRSMGVMETGKTAVAIHAPLSCRIVEEIRRQSAIFI